MGINLTAGWINEDGVVFPCKEHGHSAVLDELDLDDYDTLERGWLHFGIEAGVFMPGGSSRDMTYNQEKAVDAILECCDSRLRKVIYQFLTPIE